MKYTLRSALLTLLFASALSAQTVVDDFSNGDNWTPGMGQSGTGSLDFTSGRLVYTAPGTGSGHTAQMLPTPGGGGYLVGYLNRSWSVQVETHVADFGELNTGYVGYPREENGTAQGFMAQLIVNSAAHNGGKGLYVQAGYDDIYGMSAQASSGGWGFTTDYHGMDLNANRDVLLRASYDAASFTLTGEASFDNGATWLVNTQTSLDVRASNTGWGLSDGFSGPAFVIMLNASSDNLEVSGLDMYFDNFSHTGLTPVPEPSTYAALAGLASLGLALWRKRQKNA